MKISGKKVLVTGSARGLGYAISKHLVEESGASVGMLDIDADRLEVSGRSLKAWTYVCDVADEGQVAGAVSSFIDEFGTIDILVNNAGIIYNAPLVNFLSREHRHSVDMWDKVIKTNLRSVFLMSSFVAEHMQAKRTKGVIVNISSVSAQGNPGQSAYSAAKAGVNALTAAWARELGLLGIRVVAVAPGFIDSDSTRRALSETVLADWTKRVPLRRLAKVDEVVCGIIAAIENDYFNGKVLELDGGLEL